MKKPATLNKSMAKLHAAGLAVLLLAGCATFWPGSRSGAPDEATVAQTPRASGADAPSPGSTPGPVCPAPAPCPACPVCPAPTPPVPVPAKPLQPVAWADLPGWKDDDLRAAWAPFLQSCRGLAGRPQGAAWKRVCDLARGIDGKQASAVRRFFETEFQPFAVIAADENPSGLITGYYEPLLRGSRSSGGRFDQPVYGVPDDLVTVDLGELYPELRNLRLRGRLSGKKLVPYFSRGEIAAQEGHFPARVLLWVDDAVELFFLHVQGSGRVKLPDGNLVRLAYADQNGHPYQSVGRLLVERGELRLEEASMQGIQAWGRANPAKLADLLNANPSYVFFREGPAGNEGPLGSLGVPLTPERSLAVDPRSIPLGAPLFLATTQPNSARPLNRLMLAQDTGGAIKGTVRADFFWGFGPQAGEQAGRMRQSGRLWVLLPPEAAPK